MTVHRRALLLVVGFLSCPGAGCILISKPGEPANAIEKSAESGGGSGFAVLPNRPGEKISLSPAILTAAPVGQGNIPPNDPPPGDLSQVGVQAQIPTDVPPPPEHPLLGALRAYIENHPDLAIERLKGLDRPNQEFVLALMPALVRGASMNLNPANPTDVAVVVDQLQASAARLEGQAALRVEKILFCKQVRGFGRYDPKPEDQPYRPNSQAELYVEIRHLLCEPGVDPAGQGEGYLTKLVSCLEIRDAGGHLIEQTDPADYRRTVPIAQFERTVFSRSPLQDFNMTYDFRVPAAPGVYTATVVVRSPTGNRTARSHPVEFRVTAP